MSLVAVAVGLAFAGTAQAKSHQDSKHGGRDTSHRIARRDSHADRHHDHDRYRHHDHDRYRHHDHDRRVVRRHDRRDFRNYHVTHGVKSRFGWYFYKGRRHHHWSHRYWSRRYRCYCYYCPSTLGWYYWSEPSTSYFPVSYATVATPTVMVQASTEERDEDPEADSETPPPPSFDKDAVVDAYTPPASDR
jgi:hypothetical protein